jgi:hypothetical protein
LHQADPGFLRHQPVHLPHLIDRDRCDADHGFRSRGLSGLR